jgi:Dicarboxylate transport
LNRRWTLAILLGLAAVLLLLWIARAQFAAQFARAYFRQHGIESSVEIGALGLSSASARFALGPQEAPDISADRIELHFDPLSWIPRVVKVRLVNPVVRARLEADGKLTLGSLQDWIDSLNRQQGKSRFVSADLAVSLTGLRLLLATPGGALEVTGDAKLVKNLPVSLALRAQPTRMAYRDTDVNLRAASLAFDNRAGTLAVQFSGAVKNPTLDAQGVEVRFDAAGLRWVSGDNSLSFTTPSAHLQVAAASVAAGQVFTAPKLDITARKVRIASDGGLDADLAATTSFGFDAALAPLRAADPALGNAVRQNLSRLAVAFAGHVERRGSVTRFALTQPLLVTGAKGAVLRVPALTLSGTSDSLNAALDASLSGPGLPAAKLTIRNLVWSGGGFTSDTALTARFNFMMLHGTSIAAHGNLSWQNGRYAFTPAGCAAVTLAAFHPGASDLAKDVHAAICAVQGPLVTGEGASWKLSGAAKDASADLPLANVHAEKVAARLAFEGQGPPLKGLATITAGQVTDRTASARFKALLGTGTAALAGGVWRGRFAMTDMKGNVLGEATYLHTMATGTGTAHIEAPHIVFAPNHLQPADLSPLLVALRSAEGSAGFAGDINWTRQAITSQGKLTIATLDFMTVLGKAHAVKSEIAFTSLLPPATAPGQGLTISRIDWTIPFSAVDVRFAFSPTAVQISTAHTDIAEGHASLGAINISLADPGHIAGAAQLSSIALGSLVTASNLSSKVKLEGKVSGRIPFTIGPEGFRITNGRIAADGPGRLSVDRSLWAQGEAALSSNAVQDFAYQALENLAFEQMSAELNSIPGGRLQIVFHIKGRSDPPKPQVAEVSLTDIINGTALYKPIPLPSGTPIDLTLDTSLNFDELLKSYAEAWSKSLSPEGHPDVTPGAKP